MKKIIALILCFLMILSVCSLSSFAVETKSSPYCKFGLDEKEITINEAKEYRVKILYDMGEYKNASWTCRIYTLDGNSVESVNLENTDGFEKGFGYCIIRAGVQTAEFMLKAYLYTPEGKILGEDSVKVIINITAKGKNKKDVLWSGVCGETEKDNVKWSVNYFGDLTISGSGNIIFNSEYNAPWKAYGIKTVNVEEGITGIGAYNFAHLDDMYLIKLPKSLNHIDGSLYIGSRPEYKTIAVSYAGTESDWKRLKQSEIFMKPNS